ncbi:MAG: divalent metal cation transporter [Campylobacter sp.]|nr:divalent metal cation transporter [Campylobacter sp.]
MIPFYYKRQLAALGPGVFMATAAVGASHIISSTQAGAIYGWQLAGIILLVNLFKYPFFRFGAQYTLQNGHSMLEGYASKSKAYLWIFFVMNIFSAFVNTAAVGLLTAAVLQNILPDLPISTAQLTAILIVIVLAMILIGGYNFLDNSVKIIMTILTLAVCLAVLLVVFKTREFSPNFSEPVVWELSSLPFIVALMGWMPAPLEISAISSLWLREKKKYTKINTKNGLFDINFGYITMAVLAFVFLALGVLVQYGSGETIEPKSAKYISQLMQMYALMLGDWSKILIALIAFLCMFGTTLTVIDGYSRANHEAFRILIKKGQDSENGLKIWFILTSFIGIVIVFYFLGNVAVMMDFAMIASFLTTPIFAYLNYVLVKSNDNSISPLLDTLSIVGLVYLSSFALFFLLYRLDLLN